MQLMILLHKQIFGEFQFYYTCFWTGSEKDLGNKFTQVEPDKNTLTNCYLIFPIDLFQFK